MKKKSIYKILAVLVTAIVLIAACTKEPSDVRLGSKLSTSQVLNIKYDSATVVGFVVATGSGFTEKGVCYDTATVPTIDKNKVVFTGKSTTATFNVKIGGLTYTTKYYARAYGIDANGTVYGDEINFTTLAMAPVVTTAEVGTIQSTTAQCGGTVAITGGADITARGVCYGLNHNPTLADSKTTNGTGGGSFVSILSNLDGNTTYYARAYATNSAGTGYGQEVSFTTLVAKPTVVTTPVTGITKISAMSGGNVTKDGGDVVTARGIVWSTSPTPTISSNNIDGGTGKGEFSLEITGLTPYTTYHVRAYATNSKGTSYGSEIQFTTLANIRTWNVAGDYVAASYPGSGLADWSPDKSPVVMSTITSPDNLEGYVYMANASNNWKFATQPNWDGPNYGNGGAGILSASGDNINSPAGYYKLNADAIALTYTAVATEWGVIGSATPNAWDDETPLTYYPAAKTWMGGMHLTVNEIKFRANHSWDYNYGSTAANSTLDAGGTNIAIGFEADYFITLDLSTPNTYTYNAHRWGLIGSSTANSWDSDQNMTWDATNKVMTVTADLTVGEIKFRADDDWAYSLGGTLDALVSGGGNIAVSEAGNYTITLDLVAMKATLTKN